MPAPVPDAGQVLLEIKACGVNYPDLFPSTPSRTCTRSRRHVRLRQESKWPESVPALGSNVTEYHVGQRLAARIGTGGMAEFVAVDAERCTPIPEGMSFADAAVMQFTFETAYYALHNRARLQGGETVLVLGAGGGVGIAAVQVARNLGAHVIAAASSEEKISFARQHGASEGVLYPSAAPQDRREVTARLKNAVGTGGADVVIDPVGGWLAEAAIRCVAEGGRYLVLGFTAGIPSLPLNLPLLKNCNVLGINWRTFTLQKDPRNDTNRQELHRWYREGILSSRHQRHIPAA